MLEIFYYWARFSGIWPIEDRVADYTKITVNIAAMIYMYVGMIYSLVNIALDSKSTAFDIMSNIYMILSAINFGYIYITYITARKATLIFFENLCEFNKFGAPKNLAKANAQVNRGAKIIIWYGMFAGTVLNTFYLLSYHWCIKSPRRPDYFPICGYPFAIDYPYSCNNGISLIIHHVVIWYAFMQAVLAAFVYITSSYCAAFILIVKIDHLNTMLADVLNVKYNDETWKRLKFCINYHVHIISLVKNLSRAYYVVNTPTTFLYSATVGVCLFSLTSEITVKAFIVLVGYTLGVFCICLSGQIIIDKSETIQLTIYNMKWYEADPRIRKCILFMIAASQKPLVYKAGPFGIISLALLGSIARGAYAYMSI